jgi:hypothetical protein
MDKIRKTITAQIECHNAARETAIIECMIDALVCGDFLLQCSFDGDTVTYEPARRVKQLEVSLLEYEDMIEQLIKAYKHEQ